MKAVGIVEASCEEIFELVMSMDTTQFEWDSSFQDGSLVEEVDGHTAILYHRLQLDWFPTWSNSKLQVIVGTVCMLNILSFNFILPVHNFGGFISFTGGIWYGYQQARWFVIHHSLSKSMETYYQESGRAGRDGLPSECLLYFRPGDMPRQSSMVFYENSGLQNLYDIVRYCQSRRECRRSAFFRHFAEPLQECNGMCDNCAFPSEVKEVDVSGHAKAIVSLLQDIQKNDQRATMLQLVEKMKVKNKEVGPELKREELEQLVIQLILDRVLKEEFQHTAYATNAYVTIGGLARQVLQGKKIVKLEVCSGQRNNPGIVKSSKRSKSSGLEFKLDELRMELASTDGGIFPHSVLSTQQISMLSTERPTSMEELEKIIGKLKTDKYGSRILEEIKTYENQNTQGEDLRDEGQGSKIKGTKRLKTKKALVVIDSSGDEA